MKTTKIKPHPGDFRPFTEFVSRHLSEEGLTELASKEFADCLNTYCYEVEFLRSISSFERWISRDRGDSNRNLFVNATQWISAETESPQERAKLLRSLVPKMRSSNGRKSAIDSYQDSTYGKWHTLTAEHWPVDDYIAFSERILNPRTEDGDDFRASETPRSEFTIGMTRFFGELAGKLVILAIPMILFVAALAAIILWFIQKSG